MNPRVHAIRANGDQAWFGWPNIPQVEAEVAAWYDARTLEEEKAASAGSTRRRFDHVVYAPLGYFMLYQAWRKNLTGVSQGPLPFFWGVSKTA